MKRTGSESADDILSMEKRQRKLDRNRESARESRKRKKERVELLRSQLVHLETKNLQLRLKLKMKIGPEFEQVEESESAEITERIDTLLKQGASDEDVLSSIHQLQERYSDYGRDRRSAIDFHLAGLKRSLQPTQTTKTILWLMRCVPVLTRDGSTGDMKIVNEHDRLVHELFYSMIDSLGASSEQHEQMLSLGKFLSVCR